jgi:hypothetical protein
VLQNSQKDISLGRVRYINDETGHFEHSLRRYMRKKSAFDKHNKKSGTRALATQDTFAATLAQGYRPKAPRQTRRACRVDGTDAPVDLVVLA